MKKANTLSEISTRDVTAAEKSLDSAAFRSRVIRTDCNTADPDWKAASGQPIAKHARDMMDRFKRDEGTVRLHDFHGGVLHKFDSDVWLTIAKYGQFQLPVPAPRDLFHVYGPDRNNIKDWRRYYRYAWKDKGPNAIIYSTDAQIVQEGKLGCNAYAYSGQNSFALVGAGLFYIPENGNAKVSVRPYVPWQTTASFTGTESAPATASAYLGIWVESWKQTGGGYHAEPDQFIPVWSQTTAGYATQLSAGGTATVADALTREFTAVVGRKYAIFVYAYLETSAGPQQKKNELRFVTIDIDATVPFVVVEETLL
jgi:hypothetical protein